MLDCPSLPMFLLTPAQQECRVVVDHSVSDGPPLPLCCPTPQVIFGAAHDPAQWTAHAPEAMDGQFINEQVGGWVGEWVGGG